MPSSIDNNNYNINFLSCLLGVLPAVETFDVDLGIEQVTCPDLNIHIDDGLGYYNVVFKPCLLNEIPAVGTYDFDFSIDLSSCGNVDLGFADFNLTLCDQSSENVDFNLVECTIGSIDYLELPAKVGSSSDFSIQIEQGFAPQFYTSQESGFTLSYTPTLDFIQTFNGQQTEVELTDSPAALIDVNQYQGASSDSYLNTTIQFSVDNSTGQVFESFLLTTAEFDSLSADAQNGTELIADLYSTIAFESENSTGQSSDYELTIDSVSTFEIDFYTGQEVEGSITNPDLIDIEVYTGASSTVDTISFPVIHEYENLQYTGASSSMDIGRTLSLYPRGLHGTTSEEYELTTRDAINLDVDFYNGQVNEVDTLTEDEWHFKNYTGMSSTLDEMSVELAMEFVAENGQSASIEYLAYTATMDVDNSTGSTSEFDELFVDLGADIAVDFYTGQAFEAEDDIAIYQIFEPFPINNGTLMYDGWGGVGGINFCTTTQDHSMEYDFDARDTDPNAFDYCGSKSFIKIDVELLTNPRFIFEGYTGQSVEFAIPQKFLGFGLDDDDPRLYFTPILYLQPSSHIEVEFNNGQSSVEMNSNPDDFLAINSQSCTVDLVVQPIVQFEFGQSLEVNVNFDESDWKRGFQMGGNSQTSYFDFEPNICVRFCEGYLVPTGNNVNFDFANVDFLECFGYFGKQGQSSEMSISTEFGIKLEENSTGQMTVIGADFYNPYLDPEPMRNGQQSRFANGQAFDATNGANGQLMLFDMERRAYDSSNGASSVLWELTESVPSMRFLTDTGCLENQYYPLTPDGDIDLTYDQIGEAVEFEPFWTRLEGECVDIYTTVLRLAGEVVQAGQVSSCTLSTESTIEINIDNGSELILDFGE